LVSAYSSRSIDLVVRSGFHLRRRLGGDPDRKTDYRK